MTLLNSPDPPSPTHQPLLPQLTRPSFPNSPDPPSPTHQTLLPQLTRPSFPNSPDPPSPTHQTSFPTCNSRKWSSLGLGTFEFFASIIKLGVWSEVRVLLVWAGVCLWKVSVPCFHDHYTVQCIHYSVARTRLLTPCTLCTNSGCDCASFGINIHRAYHKLESSMKCKLLETFCHL